MRVSLTRTEKGWLAESVGAKARGSSLRCPGPTPSPLIAGLDGIPARKPIEARVLRDEKLF